MKLKMLQYLVAVADTRHFGRAAEKCFVSQPTLSAQLKVLEEQLGTQLVERRHKNILLTPVGEEIVARARRLLREADEIVELARSQQNPLSGELRIGLIPTVGPYLLPYVAGRIKTELPELKLYLTEQQTAVLLDQVRDGALDAAVLALPAETEGLVEYPVYREKFLVALPEVHPLARKRSIRTRDLEDQDLLLLEDGHCLRDQALEVCGHISVHEPQDFRGTSLETLRQMVAAGVGVTLLPELAVVETPGLTVRRFTKPEPTRTVGTVWRQTSARTESLTLVSDTIKKAVRDVV